MGNRKNIDNISNYYSKILKEIGEDSKREGLVKTPLRAAKALKYFTKGYNENPEKILKSALFQDKYNQMVIVKNIEVYSLCEHHLIPFFGKAHIAYIPNGQIVGLSKIPRVVEAYARRLQVQEKLTNQIKDCIQKTLKPLGVAVVIEAKHLCMQMRGVNHDGTMTTSSLKGTFIKEGPVRAEFMSLAQSQTMRKV